MTVDLTRAQAIEGWMLTNELGWLATQAQTHRRVVEVGSWKGRSTRALGDHAVGTVYAVDHWQGELSDPTASCTIEAKARGADAVYQDFSANLDDLIQVGKVVPIQGRSTDVAPRFDAIDFVFIDGDHSYVSICEDIAAWVPRISRGGVIAGHDYMAHHPGVIRAVNELFWGQVHLVSTIWWVQL